MLTVNKYFVRRFLCYFFPLDNHFKILSTKIVQPLKNNNFCPIVCRGPDKIYAMQNFKQQWPDIHT